MYPRPNPVSHRCHGMAGTLTRPDPFGELGDGVVEVTIPLPKEAKKETVRFTPTAS
jgi:hypothetical protein